MRVLLYCIFAMVSLPGHASDISILGSLNHTLQIGKGFNTVGGIARSLDMSFCVKNSGTQHLGSNLGGESSIYIGTLKTRDELWKKLTLNTKVGGGFLEQDKKKVNIISAKGEFGSSVVKEFKEESKFSYALVDVRKEYSAKSLVSYEVNPEVMSFFTSDPKGFFSRCGDEFVAGVITGAQVTGVMRCESNSVEEKKKLDQKIQTSGGYFAFSGSADVSGVLETMRQSSQDRCVFNVLAQGGDGPFSIDEGKFVQSAVDFIVGADESHSVVLEVVTVPYDRILNTAFHSNILSKTDITLVKQRGFVNNRRSDLRRYLKKLEIFARIGETNSERFFATKSHFDEVKNELEYCLDNVYDSKACSSKPIIFDPL